jgi:hypothetical protein
MKRVAVVTGKQIREQTELNRKDLKLLGEIGVISRGEVQPHPSVPRGRTTLHPDEDLKICSEIVRLRRQKRLSLREAATQYKLHGLKRKIKRGAQKMSAPQISAHNFLMRCLEEEAVDLVNGQELTLDNMLQNAISNDLGSITRDSQVQEAILSGFEQWNVFDRAFDMLIAGYNPILVWDGLYLKVVPDFRLGHILTTEINEGKPYIIIPLFRYIESVIRPFIDDEKIYPTINAAPKVLAKEGNKLIEYEVAPHGYLGVELLERTAKVIGKIKK